MQNRFFPEVKNNFAFGCMRLPMLDEEVDLEKFIPMVDTFIENGFNYFDTAHGYLNGASERALKKALTSRYPRDKYILANKLSSSYFNTEEEIRPFVDSQLEICGVEYFDFYLMHAQNRRNFQQYKRCRAYETAFQLKKEGKLRHVGLSFHDKAEILDEILTTYPEVEFVQIQFNYLDYEDVNVESRKCYEVCVKHNKPVLIMEPVKGGKLVKLPLDAQKCLDELHEEGSNASFAIRYAASFDQVAVVLSGMGDMDMMKDNISFMKDFKKIDDREREAIKKAADAIRDQGMIPCTGCRYCVEENHCPKGINIPTCFSLFNDKKVFHDENSEKWYEKVSTREGASPASACINCGGCERVCPQHLKIRSLLKDVASEFGK